MGGRRERFLDELQQRIGFALAPAVREQVPDDVYRDHVGVHAQKQPGYFYVRHVGPARADQLCSVAGSG